MILVIDIGNTNIKMAVFNEGKMLHSWRLSASLTKTSDEYRMFISSLIADKDIKLSDITGIILASVQPRLNYTFEHMCMYSFKIKPVMLGPGIKTGLSVKYDSPKEVGADRVATSVAALKLYGAPVIVVDFGTATTFNAINEKGEFEGGMIFPGIKTAADSLVEKTAKLPNIELGTPQQVIGKSTISNMQAGMYYGFIGATEKIIASIRSQPGMQGAKVVATGGLSEVISGGTGIIDVYDRALSLKGLNIIYDLNKQQQ